MSDLIYTKNVEAPGIDSQVIPSELARRSIVNKFIDNHLKVKNLFFKDKPTKYLVYCRNNNKNTKECFDLITINKPH